MHHNIKIAPHMFPELSIHIVSSITNSSWLEYMGWYDHLWIEPLLPINGTLKPSNRPGRQMGKTVTASIFNAWYVTFNYDKTTLLV